jgi:transcriptional regulator with XRE-family HTH domain
MIPRSLLRGGLFVNMQVGFLVSVLHRCHLSIVYLTTGGCMPTKAEKLIGSHIARFRKERELTQAELAEKIDVTVETISRMERGVSIPSIKTLEAVSKALSVRLKDLFDFEREEKQMNLTKEEKEIRKITSYLKTRNINDIRFSFHILKNILKNIEQNYQPK